MVQEKTLAARTRAACQLFSQAGETEIRGGAAHIVDIAHEIRFLGQSLASSTRSSWLLAWMIGP